MSKKKNIISDLYFKERDNELEKLKDKKTGKINSGLTEIRNCPICGHGEYKLIFIKNGFDFVRCGKCSLIYVNPMIVEEKIISRYGDQSRENDLAIKLNVSKKQLKVRGELYDYFFKQFEHRIPKGKILDIGCSIGQFLDMGQKRGYDVMGLELNKFAIEYAEKNYNVKIERKLLDECNFEDNSFDVVTMFGVIEHLTNPLEVVKDVYRLLRPGGYFIGICPNVQSLVCMVLHEQSRTFTGRLHLSYFSKKTLRYLFTKLGFSTENIEIHTKYSGINSLINYFQFLDPFSAREDKFLTDEFNKFISKKKNEKLIEDKMNELGIGLKLIFMAKK